MSNSQNNRPVTEKQWNELDKLLNKFNLTDIQSQKVKDICTKHLKYNPNEISAATKASLIKIYSWAMYQKKSVGIGSYESMPLAKGTIAENESISLLSRIDNVKYKKNNKKYSNEYISGYPDIVVNSSQKKVIDIKTSLDINSFLSMVDASLPVDYYYQMLGYLELVNADYGEVCFCLVNTPPAIIEQEIRKVKAKYFLYGKSEEEISIKIAEINNSMVFDDIPESRRVIRFPVIREKKLMENVYERAIVARGWLKEFHIKHTNLK